MSRIDLSDGESPLKASTRLALAEALADERNAEARYQAVIERHGPVRPFVNIVESERRHQARLLSLFGKYGVPVPDKPENRELVISADLGEECREAIRAEEANMALYDRWIEGVEEEDIRVAFADLRRASQENHLPAFRRCAARVGDRECGPHGAGHRRHRRRRRGS